MPHSPDNVQAGEGESRGRRSTRCLVGPARTPPTRTSPPWRGSSRTGRSARACRSAWRRLPSGAPDGGEGEQRRDAGGRRARILETACGFCIGAGQAPPRAGSRPHEQPELRGRSERRTPGSSSSPRDGGGVRPEGRDGRPEGRGGGAADRVPEVKVPKSSHRRLDGLPRGGRRRGRGPARANIGKRQRAPPAGGDRGAVTLKVGDKITTDHIMAAGARLKYRSNIANTRVRLRRRGSDVQQAVAGEQGEGGPQRDRRGLSYGQGFARARGDLPELPRRTGGHHQVVSSGSTPQT